MLKIFKDFYSINEKGKRFEFIPNDLLLNSIQKSEFYRLFSSVLEIYLNQKKIKLIIHKGINKSNFLRYFLFPLK